MKASRLTISKLEINPLHLKKRRRCNRLNGSDTRQPGHEQTRFLMVGQSIPQTLTIHSLNVVLFSPTGIALHCQPMDATTGIGFAYCDGAHFIHHQYTNTPV